MLMEYFTYEELKDIKKKVIAQHCSQKDTAELLRGLSLWNQAEERQKFFKYSVDEKSDKGESHKETCLISFVLIYIFWSINSSSVVLWPHIWNV